MRTVLPSLHRTDNATILPNVIELREKPTYVDIAYSFPLTRSVAKRCLHILPSVGSRSVEENQSLSLPISLSAEFVGGGVERGKGSLPCVKSPRRPIPRLRGRLSNSRQSIPSSRNPSLHASQIRETFLHPMKGLRHLSCVVRSCCSFFRLRHLAQNEGTDGHFCTIFFLLEVLINEV